MAEGLEFQGKGPGIKAVNPKKRHIIGWGFRDEYVCASHRHQPNTSSPNPLIRVDSRIL